MCLLSFVGHALIWTQGGMTTLPKEIAIPWHAISKTLGRPPVLSYASYALNNWYRIDKNGPIALGNIALIQNFLGGMDEEWFVLIHIDIENQAELAINHLPSAQRAAMDQNWPQLENDLIKIKKSIDAMVTVLLRMPEHCDPYIYYHRVRPYIHGWKNNPAMPKGLIYEGVQEYKGKAQFFCGETGAQSSIVPSLDAALGIVHEEDALKQHLREMRTYMPPQHREFITQIESQPSIRHSISKTDCPARCLDLLDNTIQSLAEFRKIHLGYAKSYVANQHAKSKANPTAIGTGGTPFIPYLTKHYTDTISAPKN